MTGWIHFGAGEMAAASAHFERALLRASERADTDDVGDASRALALSLAWSADQRADSVIDTAVASNRREESPIGLAQCEMAMALRACTLDGGVDRARQHLATSQVLMFGHHDANEYWLLHLTELGVAVAGHDWGAASRASDDMVGELRRLGFHPHLVRLGRTTKWERLTGSLDYVAGSQPTEVRNWLALLSRLATAPKVEG